MNDEDLEKSKKVQDKTEDVESFNVPEDILSPLSQQPSNSENVSKEETENSDNTENDQPQKVETSAVPLVDDTIDNEDSSLLVNLDTDTSADETTGENTKMNKEKKKPERERLGFNWFFWISLIVILVPSIYFVRLLLTAQDASNTPIVGSRIEDDIVNTISESDISDVTAKLNSISGVEKAEINLAVETFRITVDLQDDLTTEEYSAKLQEIYEAVDSLLPISQYFSVQGNYNQYDLEITVYNSLEASDDAFICYTLVKNSSMETYEIDDMSSARNQDLYDELTAPVEEETDESTTGNE